MTAVEKLHQTLTDIAGSPALDDPTITAGVHSVLKANEVADRILKDVRLAKLAIDEVSGVDDPATEIPGWMTMKSASIDEPEPAYSREVIQEAARLAIRNSRGSIRIW